MSTNIGWQLLNAVKRRVEALGLDAVRDVQVQSAPLDADQVRPGAYITPPTRGNGDWDQLGRKTNERQDVGYGCQVTVIGGSLAEFNGTPENVTNWRQAVRRRFHDRRLDLDDSEVRDAGFNCLACKTEPAAFYMKEDSPDTERWDATALVVRVWVREVRY